MSNLSNNKSSFIEKLGNTRIIDLLNDPGTEITKKGNKLSLRYRTEEGVASLNVTSYETGRNEVQMSAVPNRTRKTDYAEDIITMKKQGMLQKDIAYKLGISEATVSNILKRYK